MNEFTPYTPAHPKAPKFTDSVKGVRKNKIGVLDDRNNWKAPTFAHKQFRAEHKECKLKDAELTSILQAFNENMMQAAIDSRAGVTLPNRMGKLQVVTVKKGKRKRIADVASARLGVVVHNRVNTGGGIFPLVSLDISSDSYDMPNKYLWEFKVFKKHLRIIGKMFDANRTYFSPAKKDLAMRWRKDKFYKKEFAMKQAAELLLTYNEFDGII